MIAAEMPTATIVGLVSVASSCTGADGKSSLVGACRLARNCQDQLLMLPPLLLLMLAALLLLVLLLLLLPLLPLLPRLPPPPPPLLLLLPMLIPVGGSSAPDP